MCDYIEQRILFPIEMKLFPFLSFSKKGHTAAAQLYMPWEESFVIMLVGRF